MNINNNTYTSLVSYHINTNFVISSSLSFRKSWGKQFINGIIEVTSKCDVVY